MLQQATDAVGDATSYTYDSVGRRLTMVDPNGQTWSYQYDNEDRVTQASTPAVQGFPLTTQYQYDAVGNRTVVIDPSNQVTKYFYDERDQLKEVDQSPNPWTNPNGTPLPLYKTTYSYDNLANLSRVTRAAGDGANGRATDYAYDGLGRVRKEIQYPSWPATSPALVTQSSYDGDGNLTGLTKPDGTTLHLSYDALNRQTGRDNPSATFTFDQNGNRQAMVDPTGTTSYAYDELDRVTSVTFPGSVTVGYRYDLDGSRRKLVYPSGQAVTYAFDKADRLQSLQDWAGRTAGYTYYLSSQLHQVTNVNGTTETYTYDPAQRLTEVLQQQGGATLNDHQYTLDNLGNRTQVVETLTQPGGGQTSPSYFYTYDHLSQLTRASGYTGGQILYGFDPAGNRTSVRQGLNNTTATYDMADRVTQVGATSYTVDANGNLTQAGATSYGYDALNRLTSAAGTTYAYDGDGRRVTKTVSGVTTTYVDDVAQAQPALLTDQAGSTSHTYVWGLGLAEIVDQAGNVYVPHADGLGSVRALTDTTGAVVESYQTDPFGVPLSRQGSITQPFGFTGQEQDANGLVNLHARYYNPALGRFMGRDPLFGLGTLPLSLNRYIYAFDNPVTSVDPSGRSASQVAQDQNCHDWASWRVCAGPGAFFPSPAGVSVSPIVFKDPCQLWGLFCNLEGGAGGGQGGKMTFYHGTDAQSALDLLNGAPLDAAKAAQGHIDGELGFYLATHIDDAAYFGQRRNGTILQYTLSNSAVESLKQKGAVIRPIPAGGMAYFNGPELYIPPQAFDEFNRLTAAGEIEVVPAKW